jgi:diguanylate cyclase (GGDEF)-like protein
MARESVPYVTPERPPLVVIINSQEYHARALESILGPRGFAVLRAYTGRQGLERCRAAGADVILVDLDLPDMDGLELCRALRAEPRITAATPILLTSAAPSNHEHRLAALRAGAWDLIGPALEEEELALRLAAYARAKLLADRARETSMLDQESGLYNVQGLARRARELGSLAFRHHRAFACVVFSTEPDGETEGDEAASAALLERLAKAFQERGRASDALGRLNPNELAVIAQGTDLDGAVRLAERLTAAVRSDADAPPGVRVVAGIDVVPDYHQQPLDPSEMLARASRAMRQEQTRFRDGWIHRVAPSQPN